MSASQGSCRLYRAVDVLTITTHGKPRRDGSPRLSTTVYLVTDLRPDKRVADPAYRLQKLNGGTEFWDVHQDQHGANCSCPDKVFRHDGTGLPCKHIRAMLAAGLLK